MENGSTILDPRPTALKGLIPEAGDGLNPASQKGQGRFNLIVPSSPCPSSNGSADSVIEQFKDIEERGAYGGHLAKERVVQPQKFSDSVVFCVETEKGPISFLYKTLKGKGSTLYARKGKLTGTIGKSGDGFEKVNVVKYSGMINETIKTADFAEVHFSEEKPYPKDVELSHGFVGQVGYFTGDPWSIVASVESLRAVAIGCPADPGVMNKFTSAFGVITGPVAMLSAIKAGRAARYIGDLEGMMNQKIRLARGAEEFVSGGVMVAVRSVGLAASLPTASKTIIVANKVLGYISTVAGSLLYALLMIPFILDATREGNFLHDWAKKKSDGIESGFRHLVDMIGLTKNDMNDVIESVHFDTPQELYDMVKDGETAPEDLRKVLTRNEMMAIEDRVLATLLSLDLDDYPLISDWDQVRDCLLAKALKEGRRVVSKKKAEYTRRASFESYTDIREKLMNGAINFTGFDYEIDKSEEMLKFQTEMINLATKEAHSNLMLNSLVVFVCIIGIASFIGATVFTGGAPLIASLVVMLVMNVLMAGIDLYSFIEELKAMKKSSKNDMITLAIFALMSFFSLTISFMFAGNPISKGIILAIGAVMLTFQGAAAYEVYQKLDGEEEEEVEVPWHGRSEPSQVGEDLRRSHEAKRIEQRAKQVRDLLEKGGFGL